MFFEIISGAKIFYLCRLNQPTLQAMGRSKFYEEICNATDERGVESTYHKGLCMYFPNSEYTYPFKSDGYMEVCEDGKTFRLLIEYKLDELLNNNAGRAKVLIQVVWYLKQFELDGRIIPNVCIDNELAANDWAKEPVKKLKAYDAPQISSGVVVKEKGVGTIVPNALGYFGSNSNNVDMNIQYVSLYSGASSRAHGYSVMPENFTRCTALFSARKLIDKTWVNSKDEYIAPDTNHTLYQEFENDSIVFSLFHSASNQSSLRDVDYKGKKWNIYNEFFFMDKDEIMQLAEANNFDGCYNDARTAKQRFVYLKLQGLNLSKEAKTVLDKAVEIVRNTFPYRELFNSAHPEYQIMNWDCGWYQIKAIAKEYDMANYKEFLSMFKWFGDKMLPMVYQLGFLK